MSHLQSQKTPSKIGSMSDLVGAGSPIGSNNGNNIIEALSLPPRSSSSESQASRHLLLSFQLVFHFLFLFSNRGHLS